MYLLSSNIISQIKKIIKQKLEDERIKTKYPNPLLRSDIFSILDDYCTVIYYPLPEETINGFNITGIVDSRGEEKIFVYINTAQTIEKQTFTAAHELGHIWEVDKIISQREGISLCDELSEKIINRFAAELLMPEELFASVCFLEFDSLKQEEGSITITNLLKIIAHLMAYFFVPYKAIVYRIYELAIISEESTMFLMGQLDVPLSEFLSIIDKNLRDMGCIDFLEKNEKCWIDGLADLLDKAEEQKSVTQKKINNLRNLFKLDDTSPVSDDLYKKVNICLDGGDAQC